MLPPCLIRTKSLTSANKNACRVCTTPGLASSSNSENYIVLLFCRTPYYTECDRISKIYN